LPSIKSNVEIMDFVATNNNSTTAKHPHGAKRTKEVEKTNKINGSAMCI
jgi:hypothetical protein